MTWHSVKETAPLIGLCEETVYGLCASGRLAHSRLGAKAGRGRIRISDEAIEAFLRSCEVAVSPPCPAPQRRARARAARDVSTRPDGQPFKHL